MHRISAYICGGLTVIVLLRAVDYHQGLIALLAMCFYVGLLVLLLLLTSNKEAILSLLPNASNRIEKLIYVGATRIYPFLVLLIICIVALHSLGYYNLTSILLTSLLCTGVLLALAQSVSTGMDRLLRGWLVPESRGEANKRVEILHHLRRWGWGATRPGS